MQIQTPQAANTLRLAPCLDFSRVHLIIVAYSAELARIEPRRKVLQNDGVVHEHLLVPRWAVGVR